MIWKVIWKDLDGDLEGDLKGDLDGDLKKSQGKSPPNLFFRNPLPSLLPAIFYDQGANQISLHYIQMIQS